ncbi:hypothetical protein Gotri_013962, partial [Gossypium trilobum]|nr:hypothetical protein [Gossypium trilobum]
SVTISECSSCCFLFFCFNFHWFSALQIYFAAAIVPTENYGRQHPLLLLLNEKKPIDNQSGVADCSKCGEKVSASGFSCVENCGFYLHKICVAAPLKLNHPFHRDHSLDLMHHSLLIKNPAY